MDNKTNPAAPHSGTIESNLSESIIGSLPGLFYLYDDTGHFIHWNRNFEKVSGYTGNEISGMHPLEFFDEPEKAALAEKIAEVFEKGEAFLETHFFTKDKKRIPYYFNGYSITYQGKRCLIGVGIDLTERVLAEQKREESEVQLKETERSLRKLNRELHLLNNANKVVFKALEEQTLLDDLCKLLVDEGEYRMCWIGLVPEADKTVRIVSPQSIAGAGKERGQEIRIDLNDAAAQKGPAAQAILTGKQVIVNHIEKESEDERWKAASAWYGFASSVSFPLLIDKRVVASLNIYSSDTFSFGSEEVNMLGTIADNLAYALGGIRNARNKKLAEQKLRYNEENLNLIFSSTHDVIFMLSLEDEKRFKFISVNQAFLNTTGLKADQVQGKYLDEVIPPASLPMVLGKYETAIRTRQPLQWEETSAYPSGTKTGIVTITPVSGENGEINRLVGSVHDITERKKAEEDMERLNIQLRNLSSHMQTISEAERTSIAREIHDVLGQQMTALKYDIAWLKKRNREHSEEQERIDDMNNLVDETIHAIRKVSSELRPKMLDDLGLNATIEWYIAEYQKNTGIVCSLDSDFEELQFEKPVSITIYRILQEALTNVARHAQATKVDIFAKHDEHSVWLEVRDNGKGIPPADKRPSGSFGLMGMSERARMIGGEVAIKGIKDKGTSIVLTVPLNPIPNV